MSNSWNNPVIMQEAQALMALTNDLQKPFEKAVITLAEVSGRIICTGIGKSGHVATKVAATMTSLDSPAFFLNPAEAGDEGFKVMTQQDAVLAFSRSGRAVEMAAVLDYAKSNGVPIVLISENDEDSLADYATVVLKMPPIDEAWGHAPTTSTIIQMALGDALAIAIAEKKEFAEDLSAVALAVKKEF
ncbi:MAG: SIS domain-containing protein [Rhodospirillaceae bacterium]|nr:SIS domain-containing protein [Rhodospirillaceae bacterium]